MPKEKKSLKRKDGNIDKHGHPTRIDQSEMSPEKRPNIPGYLRNEDSTCTTCNVQFSNHPQLQQHLTLAHRLSPSSSEKYFSAKDKMKKHKQEPHTPIASSKRPTKSASYQTSSKPSQFQSSKPPPPGPPGPPVATASSYRHNQQNSIAAVPEDEGEFYCEECGTDYSTQQDLKKHMVNVHEEEEVVSATAKKPRGKTNPELLNQDHKYDYEDEEDDMYGAGELNEMTVQKDIIIDGYDEIEAVNKKMASKVGKLSNNTKIYIDASEYMEDSYEVSVLKRPEYLIQRSQFEFEVPVSVRIPRDSFAGIDDDEDVAEELDESDEECIEEVAAGLAKTNIMGSRRQERNFKIINDEDISEDEEDNYEYTSDDEDEIVPVSPGPARKPHVEVTLEDTDGEEEAEEIIIEKEKENKRIEEEQKRMRQYETFLDNIPAVQSLIVDPENAQQETLMKILNNAWFSKPRNWKPANPWETWNATVKQICGHYRIRDVQYDANRNFTSFQDFDDYISPILESSNPNRGEYSLYKWKKAKWLQSLDPVIPEHMKIVEESIDDDE